MKVELIFIQIEIIKPAAVHGLQNHPMFSFREIHMMFDDVAGITIII